MKKYATILVLTVCLYFSGCCKNSTGPEDKTDPIGYQKDIDWPTLADSPWPMFQHDPQGTGRSRYSGPKLGIISDWFNTIAKGGSKFTFSVIGPDDNAYLSIGNIWSDSLSETNGFLFKYDKNGLPIWKVNLNGNDLYNSPLIDKNGVIYIGSTDGYLCAINFDGSIKWKFNATSQITCGFGGVTIGFDGKLYFSTLETLYALNSDGTLDWSLPGYGNTRVLIAPNGNTLYVNNISIGLVALDQDSNLKWKYQCAEKSYSFNPLVDSNGRIYFPTTDSTYTVIDEHGSLVWKFCINHYKNKKNDRIDYLNSPTIDNMGNFYFNTVEDFYSIDYSGKLRWIIRGLGGSGSHLICDADENIYLTSGNFNTYNVFSISNSGFLNWKLSLPNKEYIFCAPSISSDGKIYLVTLSDSESKLYIIN